ncbi:MAG TPA: DinB family protein [Ohtaekwangia sp.]
MKTPVQSILSLLRRSFENNAWHGPAVKEAIGGLTQEQVVCRIQHTHSIIELVTHMTSWRSFVISRLTGNDDFEVSDELNFPKESDWQKAVLDLEKSQADLITAVENFPESRLYEVVPHGSYQYSFYTLLHGIIHHDLYHTGQIMLIRRAVEQQTV